MRTARLVVLIVGLLLCGCGGGDESSEATGTSERAPESAEASIEGFGAEAAGKNREELIGVFHGYLDSLARGDERAACTYLSSNVRESLLSLVEGHETPPCQQLLRALLSPAASEVAEQQLSGDIKRVREKDGIAFVVFHAPGARLYQLNLKWEEGSWKVALLSPSILAPNLNSTE